MFLKGHQCLTIDVEGREGELKIGIFYSLMGPDLRYDLKMSVDEGSRIYNKRCAPITALCKSLFWVKASQALCICISGQNLDAHSGFDQRLAVL